MAVFSGRMPTTRQLQCFVAVAQELNFRRAADLLNMSQPPLSRQIRNLEDLLRIKLLERDTHYVSLTSAGEAFAQEAQAILSRLDAALETMRNERIGEDADVRLGLTSVIDFSLVRGIHRVLNDITPPTQIRIEHAYSKRLLERLRSGEIDLAIVGDIPRQGEELEIRQVAREPLMVALSEAHDATRKERVSFADLGGMVLFWFPRNDNPAFYDNCERVFADFAYEPPRRPEPGEHVELLANIAAGKGIAFFPASLRAASRLGVVYRPFIADIEARLTIPLQLLWRRNETREEVLRMADRLLQAAA